jgi:hypothetical protein
LVSFYNYATAYPKDIKDLLCGSGPGTFNSRSAFMVGSPSFFTSGAIIKSGKKPYYFENYAYTLWNDTNTSQRLYQDGFRNQPFSSLLAFLGEYGLIFTLCFAFYYYRYYKTNVKAFPADAPPLYHAYRRTAKFLYILLPLLLIIDNFYEYPEIMLLIIVAMKMLQIEMNKLLSIDNQTGT